MKEALTSDQRCELCERYGPPDADGWHPSPYTAHGWYRCVKVSRPAAAALATGSTKQAAPRPTIRLAHGTVESTGLAWELFVSEPAGNQELRDIAALLIAAADQLAAEPDAVDTRITA